MAAGKIVLSGFDVDEAEKSILNNLIQNYEKKAERLNYSEIRLRLKKTIKGKAFLHEVHGTMMTDKMLNAKVYDYNLFAAVSEVLEKLMHEAEHNKRTSRQKV